MSTSFLKKYKVLQKIGEGSFSEVLKCQERETGTLYAAKRLKKIYQNVSEILESPEVIAMRKISRHPNILYMVESHYDPLPGKVTLIFELMDMSLYDLMKGRKGRAITEERVKIYLYQLLKGLEHLHKHGIFHRDIKPENILLKGDVVKLADLGSIRGIYSRPPYTEYISTRWYRSPECLLTTGFYGPKMDVWATGCVFYELLTLKPLFPGSNEVDQITKIHSILGTPHARLVAKFRRHKSRNCEYFFPTRGGSGVANLLPQVTDAGKDILKMMLVYDPENRSNVKRLLEHRYFNELRENESSPRASKSVTPSSSFHDHHQWRNPVLLSYITSERRRRPKPPPASRTGLQNSTIQLMETIDDPPSLIGANRGLKAPRIVASSPNYARQRSNQMSSKSSSTKISKSDKSNACSEFSRDEITKRKLNRAWGTADLAIPQRKRLSKASKTANKSVKVSKENVSEVSENNYGSCKLPIIKRRMKIENSESRETNTVSVSETKTIPTKRGPSTLGTRYNFPSIEKAPCDRNMGEKSNVYENDIRIDDKKANGFLPVIISNDSSRSEIPVHRGSGGASRMQVKTLEKANTDSSFINKNRATKTRLATITERTSPVQMSGISSGKGNNSFVVKSPAKKIAKHESTSLAMMISPRPSDVITTKKIRKISSKKIILNK